MGSLARHVGDIWDCESVGGGFVGVDRESMIESVHGRIYEVANGSGLGFVVGAMLMKVEKPCEPSLQHRGIGTDREQVWNG